MKQIIIIFLIFFFKQIFSQSYTENLFEKGYTFHSYVDEELNKLVINERLDSFKEGEKVKKLIESSLLNEAKKYYNKILDSKDNYDNYDRALYYKAIVFESLGLKDSAFITLLKITKSKGYYLTTIGPNNDIKIQVDLRNQTYSKIVDFLITDSNFNSAIVYIDSLEKYPPSFGMCMGGVQKMKEWEQIIALKKGLCFYNLQNYEKTLSITLPYYIDSLNEVSKKLHLLSNSVLKKIYSRSDIKTEFNRSINNIYKEIKNKNSPSNYFFTFYRTRIYLSIEQKNCIIFYQKKIDECIKVPQY